MSTATSGITNLYLYRNYVNDANDDASADSSEQETLKYTIDQVNQLISMKCARNFGSATYKEWVDAKGEDYVVLNNYPITSVKLVSTGQIDLASVENTGNPLATVSANASATTLTSIATTGVETSSSFYYSDYANVSSIVTAMDAISGWTAEVLGSQDDALTQLIRPLESGWAVDSQVSLVGPYLGNNAQIEYDSDAILKIGGSCYGKVFVFYTAGYTLPICDASGGTLTTAGNVPEGLTLVANEIVKDYLFSRYEDRNMKENNQGDYSFVRDGILSAIDRHWSDLCIFARKCV